MQYPQGMDGAAILNGMLASTIENERQRILDDLQARIDGRLQFLEQDIEGKRASYQASKEGKIARLLEADSIRRAGLEDELKALRGRLKMVRDSRIQQLNEAIRSPPGWGSSSRRPRAHWERSGRMARAAFSAPR